jgi:hypothetical protein
LKLDPVILGAGSAGLSALRADLPAALAADTCAPGAEHPAHLLALAAEAEITVAELLATDGRGRQGQ